MRMITKYPITNFPFKKINPFGVIPAEAEVKFCGMNIRGNRKFYTVKWHDHYYNIYPEDVDIVFDEHDFDGNHLDFYCSHCKHHKYVRLDILKRIPEEYDLTNQNQKEVILMKMFNQGMLIHRGACENCGAPVVSGYMLEPVKEVVSK